MLTLADIQDSSIQNIAKGKLNNPAFLMQLDEAIRRLMRKGDWANVVVPIRVCMQNGCITMPRYVEFVRKLAVCNRQVPIHDVWFDFMDAKAREYMPYVYPGRCNAVVQGMYPTYNTIPGEGWTVRAYCDSSADYGKKLVIFGTDNNGQPLRTQQNNNSWTDGITLTFTNPYADTGIYVRNIDRVIKDKTQGRIFLYAHLPVAVTTYPIGVVWNADLNISVPVVAVGNIGSQFLNLGDYTQNNNNTIGFLYNTDLQSWRNVVARGSAGAYTLDFDTQSQYIGQGGTVFSQTMAAFQPVVLRGDLGSQYIDIGNGCAPGTGCPVLFDLARYDPTETNPSYQRFQLHSPHVWKPEQYSTTNPRCQLQSAVALVKLRHINATVPNDLIVLDNLDAIKSMIQSIQYRESGELAEAMGYETDAVRELNAALRDYMPDEQVPVETGSTNGCHFGRQKVF